MSLDPAVLVGWLIVGLAAGFFAAQIERGRGYGTWADMVAGGVGAIAAGHIASVLALSGYLGRMGGLIAAAAGALLLLIVLRAVPASRALT